MISAFHLRSCGEGPESESLGTKNQVLKITKTAYKDKTIAIQPATARAIVLNLPMLSQAYCGYGLRLCGGQSGNYLVVNSGTNLFAEYPLLGTRYTTEALLALHANLGLCSHHSSALPSP
jgi:hypothetical protein